MALLATLKAGAAYLPLDPAFPPARLSLMIDEARPTLIVSESALLDRLPYDATVICLDRDRGAIEGQDDGPLDNSIQGTNLAYVIYTSGSTGRPKGVEITHASVLNLLESLADGPCIRETDTVLAHATLSFDFSVTEVWLPLCCGAHIVLADAGPAIDAALIADQLTRHQITFLQATPSLWRLLLEAGWRNGLGMTAISGGEVLPRELADALLATGAEVWNVYGPTETTVWSSVWHVAPEGPILIGHPIRGTAIHLLDENLQPVPNGAIGELCISGAGLARGYRHRLSLTAEKFVHHPLAMQPDGRLYRTGDLARQRHGLGLEYLGRNDQQIKIDGFRIEPGEVEAVLSLHRGIKRAIVSAVERTPGDKRLVAHIVHDPSMPPRVDELTALARAQLPSYMVPSAYVPLTDVPLTPTGKIDRRALPAPDWQAPGTGAAPSTAIERQLAGIWAEVLGLTDIGVDDNFFDIGGRSRLGAQVFGRIETDLGTRLPLATLFEYPTIRGLARAIERSARTPSVWRCLVPIRARGSRLPLFFIHPVGGNVLAYRELVSRLGQDIPCYGLQSVGLDGVTPPVTSVEAMALRYLDEVRSVQGEGPYHLCGFSFGGLVAFEMAGMLREQSEDVGLLALLDTDYPDYPSGPSFARLAQSPFFRARIYPVLHRARRHARTLGRLGLGGYVRATAARRPAASEEADIDPFWVVAERVRSANMRAAMNYVPRQYDGRIAYFRALHAGRSATQDNRTLWRKLARDVDLIDVPGGHSDLRLEPLVGIVAHEILQRLSRDPHATRIA